MTRTPCHRSRSHPAWLAAAALTLGASAWLACTDEERARPASSIAYVDDGLCGECHAKAAELWKGSQHDLAMQTTEGLLGRFDGVPFATKNGAFTFANAGGAFTVDAPGGGGPKRATHAFGVFPLQQVLVELDRGRLQCATVAWDAREKRWYDLYPDEVFTPGDELAWNGRYQRWNSMCAQCHSTDLEKRYDPATDSYATRWSAIDVGCQACHGPGARHVELARAKQLEQGDDGLLVHPRHGEQRAQLDTCGPCHALRTQITERWVHGEPLLDHFVPEVLHPGMYTADGQLEGEAYDWGSFLQSRMYARGVACSDCHEPHSGKLCGDGNQVCVQCHQAAPPLNRFATLKPKVYDAPEHTHHEAGTPGARCVACHMPSKTFMGIDERHDHSFRVPRPDLSVALGVPNTCNACHADKDAAWAAERLRALWPGAEQGRHWSQDLELARRGDGRLLQRLVDDPDVPAIVKATALELFPSLGMTPAARLFSDPDPLVRIGALRASEGRASEGREARTISAWDDVLRLLSDPLRAVRIEAARVAAVLDEVALTPAQKQAFDAAFAEFRAAQAAMADFPAAHMSLALVHEKRGEFADAEREYEKALEQDPAFLPARFDLGQLMHRLKRSAEAERVFRAGIERVPDEGELHHSLGLLLAELGRAPEAADALARAAALLPDDARKQYDAGLALDAAGRAKEAEDALGRAVRLDPSSADAALALAQHHASLGDWVRALPYAQQAAKLLPGEPGLREFVERALLEVEKKRR